MKKFAMTIIVISFLSFGSASCNSNRQPQENEQSDENKNDENKNQEEKPIEPTETAENTREKIEIDYENLDLPQLKEPTGNEPTATLKTNHGDIKIIFYPEYAPLACENFLTHAENGYYDGLKFHRVIEEFMIQGGDPKGDGSGGESIWGEDFAIEASPSLYHLNGAVSMANTSQPDSNSSQFFIVCNTYIGRDKEMFEIIVNEEKDHEMFNKGLDSALARKFSYPKEILQAYADKGGAFQLDGGYSVFAQVVEGMDVVEKISKLDKVADSRGKIEVPAEDVIIESIVVENNPY